MAHLSAPGLVRGDEPAARFRLIGPLGPMRRSGTVGPMPPGRRKPELVPAGPVTLAAIDHAAGPTDGPTIVLLPGLGMPQRSLDQVAALLTGWRVITFDLRGHGRSTFAPWDLPGAIADVDAVIAHFGLERPYVGGHSLGGMVALQHALAGGAVAGVVNIDGWGPGMASRYLGEDPAVIDAFLDEIAAGHLPSRLERILSGLTRQGRQGTTDRVLAMLDRADVVAWHRAVTVPSLAFNAIAPLGKLAARMAGPDRVRQGEAYRRGLRRDLAALALEHPTVTVVEVDAKHSLIRTHPAVVADAIVAFHQRVG
jgi:pimeloyl-ACP methyl ester carboxylesterase